MTSAVPPPACPPPPKPPAQAGGGEPWIKPNQRGPDGRIRAGTGFKGRKPGSQNVRSREALAAVQDLAPDAITSLRTLVKQHHWHAVRYVLDVTLPALGRTVELDSTTPDALLQAVANGEISPTEFSKIAVGMKSAMDASELKELKSQVDELEQLIGALKR